MPDADELRRSIENEPIKLEELLREIKELTNQVPLLEDKKREAEFKCRMINGLPGEVLEEHAPRLLALQRYDDANLNVAISGLRDAKQNVVRFLTSASASTASIYEATVYTFNNAIQKQDGDLGWHSPIINTISAWADERGKRELLADFLGRLHPNLAREFREALDSLAKAPSGIVGVDQAEIRLRDVLEHLWGNLVDYARQKCSSQNWKDAKFRTPADREQLARCLARPDSFQVLWLALDESYQLFKDLSPESKNILLQDKARLNDFKTRWLLQLDRLQGLIDL